MKRPASAGLFVYGLGQVRSLLPDPGMHCRDQIGSARHAFIRHAVADDVPGVVDCISLLAQLVEHQHLRGIETDGFRQ